MENSSPIKETETIETIKSLYREKKKVEHGLLFELAINSGAPLVDLLNLNVGDVKGKSYLVFEDKFSIKLSDEIKRGLEFLVKGRKNESPLFATKTGNRLDRCNVYKVFNGICKELVLGQGINVSSWRKTFGYHYYKRYNDLLYLQWRFGQLNVESTMRYIEVEENMNLRYRDGVAL